MNPQISQEYIDIDLDMTDPQWDVFPELRRKDFPEFFPEQSQEQDSISHELLNNLEDASDAQMDFITPESNTNQLFWFGLTQSAYPQMSNTHSERDNQMICPENDEMNGDIVSQIPDRESANIAIMGRFYVAGLALSKVWVEQPAGCEYCDQEFANKASLLDHISRSHNEELLSKHQQNGREQCPYCGQWFKSAINLRRHIFVTHRASEFKAKCEICDACFTTMRSATMHKTEAHGILSANAREAASKKRRYVNKKSGAIFFRCETCHYCSKKKSNVVRHIEITHIQLREHKCECGQAFKTKHNLENHKISKSCMVGVCQSMGL